MSKWGVAPSWGLVAAAAVAGAGCAVLVRRLLSRGKEKGAVWSTAGLEAELGGRADASVTTAVGDAIPHDVRVVKREEKYSGRWLKHSIVHFFAPSAMAAPVAWERVERTTKARDVDGADAFAVMKTPGKADQVILLLSYRAAVEGITVELPSGLVDDGESASVSAVRELAEETGYVGTALHVSGVLYTDCWKSTESCRIVFMSVDGSLPENQAPQPKREQAELQQVLLVPVRGLQQTLNHLEKDKGYIIDGRLRCIAQGFALGARL